ncbi:hypothetical protein EYF80_000049 [Liparis tanakae]|uniref:Uncharacterized protein n=1 Tax=Liparis tanakae TaxID=230148 RepID=A0A4Z2JGN5_9TELE|nr:hypothetical protein EYF80_000049 [Liparis tanakae]
MKKRVREWALRVTTAFQPAAGVNTVDQVLFAEQVVVLTGESWMSGWSSQLESSRLSKAALAFCPPTHISKPLLGDPGICSLIGSSQSLLTGCHPSLQGVHALLLDWGAGLAGAGTVLPWQEEHCVSSALLKTHTPHPPGTVGENEISGRKQSVFPGTSQYVNVTL